MNWFLAAWILFLQAAAWGLGLTLLILPARWRRFWPAFVAPVGLALQSAVVWAGAHTALPGTDSYALPSLALPLGLLGAAVWRSGVRPTVALLARVRRWWPLVPVISLSFALQIAPFTKPPARLTVISLGSCDAADYAAGARVFKEFSSRDRSGFLGQPEQTRGLSVDNFYDFWLRINHFTPSALLALDSSLLRRQPYELTSLLGIVLVGITLPLIFWLGRALFRFPPAAALFVAGLYGCSPVLLYAMAQVALGQLLAAPAVAIILWTSWQADRAARRGGGWPLWQYAGLLFAGNSLLLGGYNFFVVFAYVPLVASVGGRLLWRRYGWAAAGRLAGFVSVSLLACALCFPERVIGLGERFFLFHKTPFGWKISGFRPDGWYGSFGDVYLHPGSGWSLALGGVCLLALAAAAWSLRRAGRGSALALPAACALPIFCGYGILLWEESAHVRQNASYDAYKLFTVFYPVLLPSLCLWLAVGWQRRSPGWLKAGAGVLAAWLLALDVGGGWAYNAALRKSMYVVGSGLSEVAALEHDPGVTGGINVRLKSVWDALWVNQFLLHQRQYFLSPNYEGRTVTPPYGRWNLEERYIAPDHAHGEFDPLATNEEFTLLDRSGSGFVEINLQSGWYEPERYRGSRWCWGGPAPVVSVVNPHPGALDVGLCVNLRSVGRRETSIFDGQTLVWKGTSQGLPHESPAVPLHLPPGETRLRFESSTPPDRQPGDNRALTSALYGFRIVPPVAPVEKPR